MNITIINGPNLNLLGLREPDVYGREAFLPFLDKLMEQFHQVVLTYKQSNIEGELVNFLQEAATQDGIILNAAAYSHTSIAIADAIKAIATPVVEVHISNVYAREEYRKTSFIASACKGSISGLGFKGYELALLYLLSIGKR